MRPLFGNSLNCLFTSSKPRSGLRGEYREDHPKPRSTEEPPSRHGSSRASGYPKRRCREGSGSGTRVWRHFTSSRARERRLHLEVGRCDDTGELRGVRVSPDRRRRLEDLFTLWDRPLTRPPRVDPLPHRTSRGTRRDSPGAPCRADTSSGPSRPRPLYRRLGEGPPGSSWEKCRTRRVEGGPLQCPTQGLEDRGTAGRPFRVGKGPRPSGRRSSGSDVLPPLARSEDDLG